MFSDQKTIILRVVDHYLRTGEAGDAEVAVNCLPDNKTSFVEQSSDGGRSIMLDEYHVDGHVIWAGYSPRTRVVYLSSVRR